MYITRRACTDFIAIRDYSAGAMENYGLITFRESSLLFSETESTQHNRRNIAATIAHELVHQV